ncbi:hypothetical protein K7432_012400 [Basidiobolus ranarum]|uniref:DUF7082 domain-containing protein n=1 Tax=Basidiobolus ranarum TaxID=34480 RepID=A0ABR2WKW6_9FUNG
MSTDNPFAAQLKPSDLSRVRDIPRPRVLQYYPKNGSEGMPFTVVLQFCPNELLKLGFGTYVVQDTKQWNAHGYTTLSCMVPELATTKWFESKVPVCILAIEGDAVLDSWYFGEYTFSQMNFMKPPKNLFPNENHSQLTGILEDLEIKEPRMSTLNGVQNGNYDFLNGGHGNDNYDTNPINSASFIKPENAGHFNMNNTSSMMNMYGDMGVSSSISINENISGQPEAQYISDNSMDSSNFSQPNFSNSSLRRSSDLGIHNEFDMKSDESQGHAENDHNLSSEGLGGNTNSSTAPPLANYNGYSSLTKKASLIFKGHLDDMMKDWTSDENKCRRRLVQFWRTHEDSAIQCSFQSVVPADLPPNSIVVSCIYWEQKNDYYITSVDCIYLLESLIAVRFTVEEKNRIRRNLEGFRPLTISKCKQECSDFFKLIMSFPNPKPRNIEKDVKVFPWKVLPDALRKIVGKYTASYSSTASVDLDAFHNTFPPTPTPKNPSPRSSVVNYSYVGSAAQGEHNTSNSISCTPPSNIDATYVLNNTYGQSPISHQTGAQRRHLYLRRHSLIDPYALPYNQPRRHSATDVGSIDQLEPTSLTNPRTPLKIPRYSSQFVVETPEADLGNNLSPQFIKPDPILELSRQSIHDSQGISPLALTQVNTLNIPLT